MHKDEDVDAIKITNPIDDHNVVVLLATASMSIQNTKPTQSYTVGDG